MGDKLKPCSFCGLVPAYAPTATSCGPLIICHVGDCPMVKNTKDSNYSTPESWNTRPLEDKQATLIDTLTNTLEDIKKHQWVVMGMRTEGVKMSATYRMADNALEAARLFKEGE